MASVFFAMLAYLHGQTLVTTLAAAVLGAATGFLRWNFKAGKKSLWVMAAQCF